MVGLLFGSFNPIHLGHTALARYLLEHTALDEIWFVVSPHNPMKAKKGLLPNDQRLKMVDMAIAETIAFKSCDVEFSLPTPNYTNITLDYLQELYPQKQFTFIMGADNLVIFHLWRNYEKILSNYPIFVYPRKGFNLDSLLQKYPQIELVDAPLFPISSTEIRRLIKEEKDASQYLHPLVYSYLKTSDILNQV